MIRNNLVSAAVCLCFIAAPSVAQTRAGTTPGPAASIDADTVPSRQDLNRRFELSLSQHTFNFDDTALSGAGMGVSGTTRYILNERLALTGSATSGFDLTGGLFEGLFTILFGFLFGLDLDIPERGDPDHDLITGAVEFQINDPGSETAYIALAGFSRGDVIGGERLDTFENDTLVGFGIDTRLAPYAEMRARLRYVGLDGIGPDFSISVMNTHAIYGELGYYYSEVAQSVSLGGGFRF